MALACVDRICSILQLAAMQRQAANMDPNQVQHAMNAMKQMNPEQKRQMEEMARNSDPDTLLRQAENATSKLPAEVQHELNGANRLKGEGNALHKERKYKEASEKYALAVENLQHLSNIEAENLKKSCHSNLASCSLFLEKWDDWVTHCNAVLAKDANNMKALYRRGQALVELRQYSKGIRDFELALGSASAEDSIAIREKLNAARQLVDTVNSQDEHEDLVSSVVVEEIDEMTEVHVESKRGNVEEVVEEVTMHSERRTEVSNSGPNHENIKLMKETLSKDPDALKNAAKMMESMDPAALEEMMKNMPGAPPGMKIDSEQMKMAAKMMESMSPEDIERMTAMSAAMGAGWQQPQGQCTSSGGAAPGGNMDFSKMAGSTPPDMINMMQDPAMLKNMQEMMKTMDPEVLSNMLKSSGVNLSPDQVQKMANQMGSLSEKQLQRLAQVTSIINASIMLYRKIRLWIKNNFATFLALVVLLVALYLRWTGRF